MLWYFLGNFGDQKGQNLNIFLKYGAGVQCRVLLWWWCFIVSTGGRGVQAFEDSGPVIGWLWSSGAVFPAFCPLSIEEANIQRQQHLNKLNQFKKTRINLKKILHNKDF